MPVPVCVRAPRRHGEERYGAARRREAASLSFAARISVVPASKLLLAVLLGDFDLIKHVHLST